MGVPPCRAPRVGLASRSAALPSGATLPRPATPPPFLRFGPLCGLASGPGVSKPGSSSASRFPKGPQPPRAASDASSSQGHLQFASPSPLALLEVLLRDGPLEALKKVPKVLINSGIVTLFLGSIIAEMATVDTDIWRGWTLWEIISYLPRDNWLYYQESLRVQPLLTPMMITGATYLLADWIAQTYEGNALLDFDTKRLLRSTVTGLVVLGPLAHFYYTTQDAIFADIWPSSEFLCPVIMAKFLSVSVVFFPAPVFFLHLRCYALQVHGTARS